MDNWRESKIDFEMKIVVSRLNTLLDQCRGKSAVYVEELELQICNYWAAIIGEDNPEIRSMRRSIWALTNLRSLDIENAWYRYRKETRSWISKFFCPSPGPVSEEWSKHYVFTEQNRAKLDVIEAMRA